MRSLLGKKAAFQMRTQARMLLYRRMIACSNDRALLATVCAPKCSSHFRSAHQNEKCGHGEVVPGWIWALSAGSVAAALAWGRSEAHCASTQRVELGSVDDYKDGTLTEIAVGESATGQRSSIIVCRYKGAFFITTGACPHSGAKLANGVLSYDNDTPVLTSPRFDASFDLKTGHALRGSRLNSIATYPAEVSRGKLSTRLPKDFITASEKSVLNQPMSRRSARDKRVFAIVGGGAAALAAAETLRQEGFTGRIVMLTQEQHLPYDRTMLSKQVQVKSSELALRPVEFLVRYGIEVVPLAEVMTVDAQAKKIAYDVGSESHVLEYDKVLVATGATPRRLSIPGGDLPGVFTLRSLEDAEKIAKLARKNNKFVVIGGSFLSMELASALRAKNCDVAVVALETYPMERLFGRKIGGAMARILHSKGVEWLGNASVRLFRGSQETGVNGIELDDGEVLPADAVILGIGASPNTNMIEGVSIDNTGGIVVGPLLNSKEAPTMFAAGDVCTFPSVHTGESQRLEHWNVAVQQGRIAARNMLDQAVPYTTVPYFSTKFFGMTMQWVGDAPKALNQVYVEGDLSDMEFIAYLAEEDDIRAVVTVNKDSVCAACAELMRHQQMPKVSHLLIGTINADILLRAQMNACVL